MARLDMPIESLRLPQTIQWVFTSAKVQRLNLPDLLANRVLGQKIQHCHNGDLRFASRWQSHSAAAVGPQSSESLGTVQLSGEKYD